MSRRVFIAAALVLAFDASAFAQGETLLYQAVALAGNVTPGDPPGFPIVITRPGTYKFSSNITPPEGGSGIFVAARNVTIDLNGFELYGEDANIGIGSSYPGLTVKNGTIYAFDFEGISYVRNSGIANTGEYWIVENMRIIRNNRIGAVLGDYATVRDSTFVDNSGTGVVCGKSCQVEKTIASDNGGNGVVAGPYSSVRFITAYSNGGNGISCSDNCLLESNLASDNDGAGIAAEGGAVLNTSAFDNTGPGLSASLYAGAFGNSRLSRNNGSIGNPQAPGYLVIHPNFCNGVCP